MEEPPLSRLLNEFAVLPGPFALLTESIFVYTKQVYVIIPVMVLPWITTLVTFFISPIDPTIRVVSSIVSLLVIIFSYGVLVIISQEKDRVQVLGLYRKGVTLYRPLLILTVILAIINGAGFVVLLVPGIYLSVMFAVAPFVLVSEGKMDMRALAISWYYVRGVWGQVFGRLAFLLVISVLASAFVAGVSFLLGMMFGQVIVITALFGQFFNAFIIFPISVIYTAEIYAGLRKAKSLPMDPDEEVGIVTNLWWLFVVSLAVIVVTALVALSRL